MKYRIAETRAFQKEIEKPHYKNLYKKLKEYVYPTLRQNPFFGPNVKRLKGKYSEYYRHRIGDYRLIYTISGEELIIFMISIQHRKEACT